MMKKNKISKKINKIIPAVLLSGAMLVPMSQLTSPIVADAYEHSATRAQDSNDYTPTVTELVDAPFKGAKEYTRNARSTDILMSGNGEVTIDLTKDEFHTFDAKFNVPETNTSSVRYKIYLDDRCVRNLNLNPGEEKNIETISLIGDDAKELKIVTTSSGNARSNNPILIENAKFTTYCVKYSDPINVKRTFEISSPKRVCKGWATIGNSFPSINPYLTTNKQVTFETVSTDPYFNDKDDICVTTSKDVTLRTFGAPGNCVTIGAKIKYNIERGTRIAYVFNKCGCPIASFAIKYETKVPDPYTLYYTMMNL